MRIAIRSSWPWALLAAAVSGVAAPAPAVADVVPLVAVGSESPLPNGNDLVRSMVDRQRSFEKALEEYTYDVAETEVKLDDSDRVKESHLRRRQIFVVSGVAVSRLVEEDGRPLSPDRAEKEEKRVRKAVEKARAKDRSAKEKNEKEESELRISEILARYDFAATGRETVGGRPAVLVAFRALPGKRDIKQDGVFRALKGRLWIDEEARAVVRAEVSNDRKIKLGGGLVASISDIDVAVDFVPVDDVWLPRRSQAFAAGRVLLVKGFRQRVTQAFSNYRRFVVSSEATVGGTRE